MLLIKSYFVLDKTVHAEEIKKDGDHSMKWFINKDNIIFLLISFIDKKDTIHKSDFRRNINNNFCPFKRYDYKINMTASLFNGIKTYGILFELDPNRWFFRFHEDIGYHKRNIIHFW